MKSNHQFKLIDGKFDNVDAGRLLIALVGNKIKYHNVESFRIQERHNGDVAHSEKRVRELTEVKEDLKELIAFAMENELDFKIDCSVNIELVPENKMA
tara:strand:- start:6466 stop:6759 length:294 start_codon:yes stop_codon:yes gene_type:complete